MSLESFLIERADSLKPVDLDGFSFDAREYVESINDDALTDAWLENKTSYIWRVGLLAQWDTNKCDWVYVFIGHEREPGRYEFIGMLSWEGGENDDVARCFGRYRDLLDDLWHPVFHRRDGE